MSSRSHQNYTRKWANKLGFPVFSIDYRLAPKNPYPKALDDVFQAYYWMVSEGPTQLGLNLKNVILAGDSAGGNLCLTLMLRIIHTGIKRPIGLCVAYPGILNLSLLKLAIWGKIISLLLN